MERAPCGGWEPVCGLARTNGTGIYRLAALVIRVGVTPIPIIALVPAPRFGKGVIFAMPFAEIHAIGTVFVIVPIVVVPVVAIVVADMVLRRRRKSYGR